MIIKTIPTLALTMASLILNLCPVQAQEPPLNKDLPRPKPDAAWKSLGDSLWFDPARRELVILAQVVLRDGPLEHLLCLRGTKEHEAILATSAEARAIHAGLLLTKAEPGHPVRFEPKFESPTGSAIKIQLVWTDDKKQAGSTDAKNWIKNLKTEKPITIDWVFGGSIIVQDPRTKKPFYAATEGDYFTVTNFTSAILDLPVPSSSSDADRQYVAFTQNIAPLGTWVYMRLSPKSAK